MLIQGYSEPSLLFYYMLLRHGRIAHVMAYACSQVSPYPILKSLFMQKSNKRPVRPKQERLMQAEDSDPHQVFAEFCSSFHLQEVRQTLWDWLTTAVGKSPSLYDEGKERSNLFFFYEQLNSLTEAVFRLQAQAELPKVSRPKAAVTKAKSKESGK